MLIGWWNVCLLSLLTICLVVSWQPYLFMLLIRLYNVHFKFKTNSSYCLDIFFSFSSCLWTFYRNWHKLYNGFFLLQVDEFHSYCRPKINPQLSEFCTQLTGITQVFIKLTHFIYPFLFKVLWVFSFDNLYLIYKFVGMLYVLYFVFVTCCLQYAEMTIQLLWYFH